MSKTKTYEEYKLKSGKKMWHVHAYLGTDSRTGKAKYFDRRKFATKADAKRALIDAKADFQRGLDIGTRNSTPTLSQVHHEWLNEYRLEVAASTFATAEGQWRLHIEPIFGSYHVDQINAGDCQKWVLELAKTLSVPGAVKALLNQVMKYAIRMGYIQYNPVEAVKMPRKHKPSNRIKKNYYELDELEKFVDTAYDNAQYDLSNSRYVLQSGAMLLTLASTGVRSGEIRALRWENIDLQSGIISIEHSATAAVKGKPSNPGPTKTPAAVRTVEISGKALDLLKQWHKYQLHALGLDIAPKQYVFAMTYTPSLMPSGPSIIRRLDRTAAEAGIRRITPHGLRHTKATLLNYAHADPADISAILGHTNSQFTLRTYVHPTSAGIDNAESKFRGLIDL